MRITAPALAPFQSSGRHHLGNLADIARFVRAHELVVIVSTEQRILRGQGLEFFNRLAQLFLGSLITDIVCHNLTYLVFILSWRHSRRVMARIEEPILLGVNFLILQTLFGSVPAGE